MADVEARRRYDLTKTFVPFLDVQMVLPLLQFAEEKELYPKKDISQQKLKLASKTKMLALVEEEYLQLFPSQPVPKELKAEQSALLEQLKQIKATCAPYLKGDQPTAPISKEMAATLYKSGKFAFDCGQYQDCARALEVFISASDDDELVFAALWGKLAAEILMENVSHAWTDLSSLKKQIDSRTHVDQLTQLQQRTWLLHWSLFILFHEHLGEDAENADVLSFLFQDTHLNAIQINAPHLLRYLVVAHVLFKSSSESSKSPDNSKELIRVLQQERKAYSDPITELLLLLHVDYDLEAVPVCLEKCRVVLENDLFLDPVGGLFMNKARQLFFEAYCKLHHSIQIEHLAQLLNFSDDVEKRVSELLEQSPIVGKIDAAGKTLIITPKRLTVSQQLVEKTKHLQHRSEQVKVAQRSEQS